MYQIGGKRLGPVPRYQWAEGGPGCGTPDHASECLCDVTVGAPAPIVYGAEQIMFGRYAMQMAGADEVSAENFVEWATLLLGGFEAQDAFDAGRPSPDTLTPNMHGRVVRGPGDPYHRVRRQSEREPGILKFNAARAAALKEGERVRRQADRAPMMMMEVTG